MKDINENKENLEKDSDFGSEFEKSKSIIEYKK